MTPVLTLRSRRPDSIIAEQGRALCPGERKCTA